MMASQSTAGAGSAFDSKVSDAAVLKLAEESLSDAQKAPCLVKLCGERCRDAITVLDLTMGGVIVLNAVVMGVESQWRGYQNSVQFGITSEEGKWKGAEEMFQAFEHLFALAFTCEFALRICWIRQKYFRNPANLLDFALVLSSLTDLYILGVLNNGNSKSGGIARILRVLKICRILRIIRLLKVLAPLRFLVVTMYESTKALFWPMMFLFIIMTVGGFIMCQLAAESITDAALSYPIRQKVHKHFGIPKLKGAARSIDVIDLQHQGKSSAKLLRKHTLLLHHILEVLEKRAVNETIFRDILSGLAAAETARTARDAQCRATTTPQVSGRATAAASKAADVPCSFSMQNGVALLPKVFSEVEAMPNYYPI